MSTLQIKGSAGFLTIFFRIYPLLVSINGAAPQKISWSGAAVPAPAGNVDVEVFYKFYWFLPASRATTSVNLAAGQPIALVYKPSLLLFFLKGKLKAA